MSRISIVTLILSLIILPKSAFAGYTERWQDLVRLQGQIEAGGQNEHINYGGSVEMRHPALPWIRTGLFISMGPALSVYPVEDHVAGQLRMRSGLYVQPTDWLGVGAGASLYAIPLLAPESLAKRPGSGGFVGVVWLDADKISAIDQITPAWMPTRLSFELGEGYTNGTYPERWVNGSLWAGIGVGWSLDHPRWR